jgi:DNA segregation ATPase FtsK/SpoIIIE-like protein
MPRLSLLSLMLSPAEPEVEEVKPTRPPMYYFEEVEERRAREREQLAAWYQPVPEPARTRHQGSFRFCSASRHLLLHRWRKA